MKINAVTECIDINNYYIFVYNLQIVVFSSIMCLSLSHLILFDLNSTSSDNKIKSSIFFFLECPWLIFEHPFVFNLSE